MSFTPLETELEYELFYQLAWRPYLAFYADEVKPNLWVDFVKEVLEPSGYTPLPTKAKEILLDKERFKIFHEWVLDSKEHSIGFDLFMRARYLEAKAELKEAPKSLLQPLKRQNAAFLIHMAL